MRTKNPNAIRDSRSDKVLYFMSGAALLFFTAIVLYPLIYILSCSFSDGTAVSTGRFLLWPVKPSLKGYEAVFVYDRVLTGYINTIFYTVAGTVINLFLTLITAYPLAMPGFQFKKAYLLLFTFTMFFSGGLVPSYLLMSELRLVNTVWAMLLPGAMSVYNMIVTRTYFQNNIPESLFEAARIDGSSEFGIFFKIVLPLSAPIIAVITLYYAVSHWSSYFSAMIYITDVDLHPLQVILRKILIMNETAFDTALESGSAESIKNAARQAHLALTMKYSLVFIASAPMLIMYPFVQKFFVKGIMVGFLKG